MKNKLFTIALCLLLLLSGLIVVAQRAERADGVNEVDENGILRDQKGDESIEKTARERMDGSNEWESTYGIETGYRNYRNLNREPQSMYEGRDLSWDSTSEGEEDRVLSESPQPLLNYDVVDPIRIDNNADLAAEAISGSGTEADPYLIEGYEIDGGGYGYSLYIGNVTDHFEVNECYLHNASGGRDGYSLNSGLHLFNTSNGHIRDNIVSNNSQNGVYLDRTSNNRVSNNTVHSNEGHEILLDESDDNKVMNNDVVGEDFSSDQLSFQDDVDYCQDSVLIKLESPDEDKVRSWGEDRALKFKTDEIANTIGGRTSSTYPAFDMAEIAISEDVGVKEAVGYLNGMDEVITAEPNYLMEFQKIPNDPGYDSLWAMPTIDAPEAWDITTGSEEVVVAVIDTGIDYTHPDLRENMWTSDEGHHGYNAVNDSYYPMDDYGHGTHVAGTIGAVGDNDQGVVGVNWDVSLMGIKIGDMGGLTTANAIAGLEYVLERKREGENIVATSNSWGGTGYSELLYEAIEQHQKEDISFVAAAGNNRADTDEIPFYPANYDLTNIISVAATNEDDNLAFFSNYGKRSVHVGAPGVNINSTMLDGEYIHASGTSMAAPHVAGLMALIASHETTYDHNQLKNAILSSADGLDSLQNLTLTDGRINAHQALEISPDPDDIRLWVHRPTSRTAWGEETPISISLNDGINPVLGANVSVEFSTGEDTVYLEDDGSRGDLSGDGYYTGGWTPRTLGEVNLTITAKLEDDREMTKNLTVEISGEAGIALLESKDNILSGNNITRNFYGISIYNSESNEISDNPVENNYKAGIRLHESKGNELINQNVSNSEYGLFFENSNENLIVNGIISDTSVGAMLQDTEGNTFSNNLVSQNFYGFVIENSRGNKFIENELLDNFFGMIFYQSSDNVIDSNTIDNQIAAILLQSSEDNFITDNTLTDTGEGILLRSSDDNELHNNEFSTDTYAIHLQNSKRTTLTENNMIDVGVYMIGVSIEHWTTHSIDTSNTVNDDPVYYWKNRKGGTVPQGAGQVILANCEEVRVRDQDIEGGSVGILLGFSSNNILKENSVTDSKGEGITLFESDDNILENNIVSENAFSGILMFESDGNIIANNAASRNNYGIITLGSSENKFIYNTATANQVEGMSLYESDGNILKNNEASENRFPGLFLMESSDNELMENTVEENMYGLYVLFSKNNTFEDNHVRDNDFIGTALMGSDENMMANNTVEHNDLGVVLEISYQNILTKNMISENDEVGLIAYGSAENLLYKNWFIENEIQAQDDGDNEWDAGDPADDGEGGNYWSDYTGIDRGDGIGNRPYEIEGEENQDNYPWMTYDMVLEEEEEEKNILEIIIDRIQDIIDAPQTPDRREIPGFSFPLLVLGMVTAVAIHHRKKR